MGIKRILVPIDGGNASFAALEQAFVVARRFDAHVEALHIMPRLADSAAYGMYTISAQLRKELESQTEKAGLEKAAELRAHFHELCREHDMPIELRPPEKSGPSASWEQKVGGINEELVRHGRLSDVIVARRPSIKSDTVRRSRLGENIESLLLATARPVLLVPPNTPAKACSRVAFGWNESAEATRALAMTLSWLKDLGEITVIVSKKRQPRVDALLDYLNWHGVRGSVQLLDGRGKSVGESLLNVCADVGAELLVIGGFSHARARQLLFGGVTQHLFAHSNILTAMVH